MMGNRDVRRSQVYRIFIPGLCSIPDDLHFVEVDSVREALLLVACILSSKFGPLLLLAMVSSLVGETKF